MEKILKEADFRMELLRFLCRNRRIMIMGDELAQIAGTYAIDIYNIKYYNIN